MPSVLERWPRRCLKLQYILACVFIHKCFQLYCGNCIDVFLYLDVCAVCEELSAVEIEFCEGRQAQLPVSQMISLNGI